MINSPVVPLPVVAIGLNLATLGLKVHGGAGAVLELLKHPFDLLARHRGAADLERRGKHFKKSVADNKPLGRWDG